MRVILYGPDFNKKHEVGWVTTLALSEGLTKLGIEHDVRRTKHFVRDGEEIADICIVNGWIKKHIDGRDKINRNMVIRAQIAAGKPPWCIERAFLLDRDQWSAMSIGGFCSNGDFRAEGMPPDRWDNLGIELQPWRTGGDHILFCAQVPWDAQVDNGNHLEWINTTVREIKKHTDRPILFRGHPKAWRQGDPYRDIAPDVREMLITSPYTGFDKAPRTTFEQNLEHAHAVVCYNSNVAVLATVAGYPVFTGAPCLADPISFRADKGDFRVIKNPPERCPNSIQKWANDLAYKQWHVEEFREAKPWLHLTR